MSVRRRPTSFHPWPGWPCVTTKWWVPAIGWRTRYSWPSSPCFAADSHVWSDHVRPPSLFHPVTSAIVRGPVPNRARAVGPGGETVAEDHDSPGPSTRGGCWCRLGVGAQRADGPGADGVYAGDHGSPAFARSVSMSDFAAPIARGAVDPNGRAARACRPARPPITKP
jgi:hypothetical protein